MAISLPTPSGNTGVNDWADAYNNDAQLVTEIDDRDGNYQTILAAASYAANDTAAGTYVFSQNGGIAVSGTGAQFVAPIIYFDDADYTVASKTQKLRVRAQIATNATQPVITFTVGLYPVTVAGGADGIAYTLGTVISGSTVAFASPAASTVTQGNSGDFTVPSDGAYALGVVTSGALTNNNVSSLSVQVQTRWV